MAGFFNFQLEKVIHYHIQAKTPPENAIWRTGGFPDTLYVKIRRSSKMQTNLTKEIENPGSSPKNLVGFRL